eukprot:gene9075-10043_t
MKPSLVQAQYLEASLVEIQNCIGLDEAEYLMENCVAFSTNDEEDNKPRRAEGCLARKT